MNRLKGLYILDEASFELVYGRDEQREVAEYVDIYEPPQSPASVLKRTSVLKDAEVIFSGWGGPRLDRCFLEAAPNLRAVFYGAGSVRPITTDAFWEKGIVLTSAYAANALPVAEYTLSTILLSLKQFWKYSRAAKRDEGWGDHTRDIGGTYRATVGFVSCGMIARKTLELLRAFDVKRLVYCPFLSEGEAERLNVQRCSLDEVFHLSDVVSLHTPQLPETVGLIEGRHIASMRPGATLINTARGAIIREQEMIQVLRSRPDLTAVLDVCEPEPPLPGSGLTGLENIVLTPHIAGSMGREIMRLGRYMVDELRRYVNGRPLKWQITKELAEKLA